MSKQIQKNEEIYLTPSILGKYENDKPIAIDKANEYATLDPKCLDDKIKIYEREVKEWFLDPASSLLRDHSFNNAFIILMICMSYIEGVEQYKTGVPSTRRSKMCFIDSFKRLYPNRFRNVELEKLYDKSRCGLFHNGMVKGGVIFNYSFEEPIKFENNGEIIKINPRILLEDIRNDFEGYIRELKTINCADMDDELKILKENFNRMFTVVI